MRLMPALRVPPVAIKSSTCSAATHNSFCDHPSTRPLAEKCFPPPLQQLPLLLLTNTHKHDLLSWLHGTSVHLNLVG